MFLDFGGSSEINPFLILLPLSLTAMAIPVLLRLYWLPLLLFAIGLFFQLVVLPSSYPPSHYDVLGIERFATIEQVEEAYHHLSQKFVSGVVGQSTPEIIKIRYAYELLTNPVWKRDYDHFGLDEQLDVFQRVREQYQDQHFLNLHLPLLNSSFLNSAEDAFNVLTREIIMAAVQQEDPLLIQVYSTGSHRCAQFSNSWKRIDSLLNGIANTGMVELGDVQLAAYLAERKFTNQPFFQNGLPALVAYPANCRSPGCFVRYQGELSVDAVVDWMATTVIGLPRILYYSKESLVPKFIGKSAPHKVKVICFSSTGERAAPSLRQAARNYSNYASFAFVLWREEDSQVWWNTLGVESAPAIVFLKGPGVKPIVYHGTFSSSQFREIMEEHKHQELPQLRSDTSLELGCDARGHSRAANDTIIWYCVVVAGRHGVELSKMRATARRAQDKLVYDGDSAQSEDIDFLVAAAALKEKRLTFTWLDGELQKKICAFYLSSDYEGTCGPRVYGDMDVPRLFLIRFQRNLTDETLKAEKRVTSLLESLRLQETNYASQLVARYTGSEDIEEIIRWISKVINDGDTREIPYFTQKVPDLVPEETKKEWVSSAQGVRAAGRGLKETIQNTFFHFGDYLSDPRVGPSFLLCACISFGAIWLKSSPTTPSSRNVRSEEDEAPTTETRRRRRARESRLDGDQAEPKDAYQLLASDSDSD